MQDPIHITEQAVKQINAEISQYKVNTGLDALISLSIKHRGCASLAYHMEFTSEPAAKDYVIDKWRILLKAESLMWMMGTVIDYQNDGTTSGFMFINPHQKRTCHCGEAFYI